MEGAVVDEGCAVFGRLDMPLAADSIHRFVVGEDQAPRKLADEEIQGELGDPFATELVLKGVVPRTAEAVLDAFRNAVSDDDPLQQQMSFILGEGSQIPVTDESADVSRNLRFLITCGTDPVNGPDVLLSVSSPHQADAIELMAWDRVHGGFNYYRTVGEEGAWVFAGNSRHALAPPTEGKGPFESHMSGSLLMKELRAPWINWHSPDANILPSAFASDDPRRDHRWFIEKEPLGAVTCEAAVARPAIARWVKARFSAALAEDGTFASPRRVMQQVLGTPTANLITSHVESRKAVRDETFDIPQTFFIDSEALTETLGLQPPPPFRAIGSIYAQSLQTFETRMDDDAGFVQPGDTHFAFLVPERAFEDLVVLREALAVGLLSRRLAVSLLMTDFPNPIFSERREALIARVPTMATISNGSSIFSQEVANAILATAEQSPEGSPEREFADLWEIGEDFVDAFNALLEGYYQAVTARLATQKGFDAYYRLAESRREKAKRMPIFGEFSLLFARTNIPGTNRTMRRDGTVAEG
jgi:hypothetical protein